MTWLQAIGYFFREALLRLRRGWRVSLLAVFTIAVSLFLGGLFTMLGANVGSQIEVWRGQARVVVYLQPTATLEVLERERVALETLDWVESVRSVTVAQARGRFESAFPDLIDVLDDPDADPLPPSLEVVLAGVEADGPLASPVRERLESIEGFDWLDDDRAWLDRLETFVEVGRGIGWLLGGLLLGAAVFTIASVIRLTAYRYREEIAVMRQIGATELLIRCPFYVEGLLQGLAGGVVATLALGCVHLWLRPGEASEAIRVTIAGSFLPVGTLILLVGLGGLAGAAGAVLSLRREVFDREPEVD